ncbi:MAG: WYL domain-containing protein [Hyphomicrobiales bacterium]|nr:WYL domain-containing protein [Hyphomicrobiales bacterium]
MTATELKWATEQRFQIVEYQAFWLGSLNRVDLTSYFGISVPQASKDLATYQSLFPQNIRYDHSEKRYFVTKDFHPKFIELNSDDFLSGLLTSGGVEAERSALPTESVPVPQRRIDPYILQSVVECVANDQSIEILYQSMNPNKPEPMWRRITPHSFATDGLRWHTRAYCHVDEKFKDFLLSRFLDTRELTDPGAFPKEDFNWKAFFEVRLVPNPALSKSQKDVIEADYDMTDGTLKVSVRMAMLYYFEKRLRLDVGHLADEPGECPVVIENKEAFNIAVREATN